MNLLSMNELSSGAADGRGRCDTLAGSTYTALGAGTAGIGLRTSSHQHADASDGMSSGSGSACGSSGSTARCRDAPLPPRDRAPSTLTLRKCPSIASSGSASAPNDGASALSDCSVTNTRTDGAAANRTLSRRGTDLSVFRQLLRPAES